MSNYRNEVTSSERSIWKNNFAAESGNIFDKFQNTPIVLSKSIYEQICIKYNAHLSIYFGLDNSGNPQVIALPTYKIDELDSNNLSRAWDDITGSDSLFELYSNKSIDINTAKTYLQNWLNNNSNHEFFIRSFIFPRTNFIQIFENQNEDYALLDFGLKKQIKVMTQSCDVNGNPASSPIVADYSWPCPPTCRVNSDLHL